MKERGVKKVNKFVSDVTNLFTFLQFPESIQRSLYSTNIIENFSKHLTLL